MENIVKKLEKAGLTTKQGLIRKDVINALRNCKIDLKRNTIHYFQWIGRPRYKSARDNNFRLGQVLGALGYKVLDRGNDSPRGGKEGDYFKVSPKAAKVLYEISQL